MTQRRLVHVCICFEPTYWAVTIERMRQSAGHARCLIEKRLLHRLGVRENSTAAKGVLRKHRNVLSAVKSRSKRTTELHTLRHQVSVTKNECEELHAQLAYLKRKLNKFSEYVESSAGVGVALELHADDPQDNFDDQNAVEVLL